MARKPVDPSELTRKRMRRAAAAAYLTEKLGPPVSPNTLRSWKIPYKVAGRDASYAAEDLDAFATARLAAAAVRLAGTAPDLAAVYQDRLRQISGEGAEEESKLLALGYAAGVASAHYRCGAPTAVRLVRDQLKEKV